MRFSLMVEGQQGPTWDLWTRIADACERLGFEALFSSDHYFPGEGPGGRGSFDAPTILAALASRTERLRLGTMVSPVTFRHPSVFAKIMTTIDHVSGGRAEIALGAGWWEEEHRMHGIPFLTWNERFEMLAEQLEIVHGAFTQDRFSLESAHYALEDLEFLRKPVQRPHPPIIVGGSGGPRIAELVARWADEFNTVGATPQEVRDRFARVRRAVSDAGRDPSSVRTSMMTWFVVGRDEEEFHAKAERARSFGSQDATFDAYLEEIRRDWIVGTPKEAIERLREYEDAGVQRIVLNHHLYDDFDMLELLGTEIAPALA
ncbi:MAG TPA: TIGR03560 family F420-dependent LLM class oxidoreductase [Actinomycetota bacterium]|jgi:F420-dependent oxidoreductase-like protein